jgi:excisionase family DNA binding protein
VSDRAALIAALLADPSRAEKVPPEERQHLVAALAALTLALLSAPTPKAASRELESDALLSAQETAALLGVSVRRIYRDAGALPFTRRLGPRTLRFSRRGLERWIQSGMKLAPGGKR